MVVDGSGVMFQFYSNGIYNSTECSKVDLNQAMLLVGYGTDSSGGDYWIVKNRYTIPYYNGNLNTLIFSLFIPPTSLQLWHNMGTGGVHEDSSQ